METEVQILLLSLAWFLGLLGPTIVRGINRRRRKKEIGRALIGELELLLEVVASSSYRLRATQGLLNEEIMKWYKVNILPLIRLPGKDLSKIESALSIPPDIANKLELAQQIHGAMTRYSKHEMRLFDTHTNNLDLFKIDFQKRIVFVRHYLDKINTRAEYANSIHDKTFSDGINQANMNTLVKNAQQEKDAIMSQSWELAKDIKQLISDYKPQFA